MERERLRSFPRKLLGKEKVAEPSILDLYPDLRALKEAGQLEGKHMAFILDGNGRWAQERGLPVEEGHKMGAEATIKIMRMCKDLGMDISLWILSPDNIKKRSKNEIQNIYKILGQHLNGLTKEAQDSNGRIIHIGETQDLPISLRIKLYRAQRKTRNNTGPRVGLAVNYSQEKQLVSIAKQARRAKPGTNFEAEGKIRELMYGKGLIKPADMIVRFGKVNRLSYFVDPFQGPGTQLYFPKVYLPDATAQHVHDIIIDYFATEKTLGGRTKKDVTMTQNKPQEISQTPYRFS